MSISLLGGSVNKQINNLVKCIQTAEQKGVIFSKLPPKVNFCAYLATIWIDLMEENIFV